MAKALQCKLTATRIIGLCFAITVEVPEPDMHFGTGWEQFAAGYKTSVTGSTFAFDFNGISLTWYGSYDGSFPFAATTAAYTVDGGPPTSFNLNGVAATKTAVQYNQLFFTTPTYPPGVHTLEVTYQGNTATTPLALEFIIIQNGTSTTTTSSSSIASASSGHIPPSSSPSSNSTHQRSDVAPIVGGVVGGLALIIAATLLFFFLRRRAKCPPLSDAEGEGEDMRSTHSGFVTPYTLDSSTRPPSTSKNRTIPANPFAGNLVVGKHNMAANEAREAGQSLDNPRSSNTSSTPRLNNVYASYPIPTSTLRPVRRPAATHGPHHSSSSANISDIPSNSASGNTSSLLGSSSIPAPSNNLSQASNSPMVVHDEDSGIRIRQTDAGDIVVLPPLYTAS